MSHELQTEAEIETEAGEHSTIPLKELLTEADHEEATDANDSESKKSETETLDDKQQQTEDKQNDTTIKEKKETKKPLTQSSAVPKMNSNVRKSKDSIQSTRSQTRESVESKKGSVSKVSKNNLKVPEKRKRSVAKSSMSNASLFAIQNNNLSTHTLSDRSGNVSRASRSKERVVPPKEPAVTTPKDGIWATKKKRLAPIRPVEKPKEFVNLLLDSDVEDSHSSDSSEQETEQVIQVDEVSQRSAIINLLKQLPEINDISETSLVDSAALARHKEKKVKRQQEEEWSDLKGHFVDNVSLDSHSELSLSTASEDQRVGEESTMPKDSIEDSFVSSLSFISTDSNSRMDLHSRKSVANEEIATKMTKIKLSDSKTMLFEYPDISAQEHRQTTYDVCELFLGDLIQMAVHHCEQHTVRLQRVLDKKKLITALIPLCQQFEEERLYKEKLQQLTRDYFVRKKHYGFLTHSQYDKINCKRYHNGLTELDRLLALQAATVAKCAAQTAKLREEAEGARLHSDQKVNDWERAVRETLITKESFTHLNVVVNNVLKSMGRVWDELSEMRLELINTQHRVADIAKKSEALEGLGEGLYMREYLTNQTDVQILSAKIAERNADMDRLHMKINFDVHALAHLKCKEHMSRKTLNLLISKLKACEESRRNFRDLIYQGKLKHNKLRKELDKIKTSGSLIYYPDLIRDYDKTVDALLAKRESVEKLRAHQSRLIQRIALAESRLNSIEHKNSIRLIQTVGKKVTGLQSGLTVKKL